METLKKCFPEGLALETPRLFLVGKPPEPSRPNRKFLVVAAGTSDVTDVPAGNGCGEYGVFDGDTVLCLCTAINMTETAVHVI
jgi:hypothetical protein